MTLQVKSQRRWWVWIVGIVATIGVLFVIGSLSWLYFARINHEPTPETTKSEEKAAPYITKLSSNSLFTGNIYWGRYLNDWSRASDLKTAYPFSRLKEFNRDSYQNWIAGLECPLAAGVNLTSAQEEDTLSFNCSPEYLPEAAKWFNIVTLANNHTDNQGVEAFTETQKHLDEHKIQYFGHYDPRALEDLCEVVSINAIATYSDNATKNVKLPVALCGYHGVFRIPTEEALAVMEKYSEIMPVIAMPHAGAEYKAEPDELKTNLYRSMIDHGADIVIGDHPHWIQSTEAYKGKLIVYSMGNFIFDQQFNKEVTRSATIRLLLGATGKAEDLAAWTALGEKCGSYHDTCLDEAKEKGLTKLDFSYKYDAIGSTNANRLAHPASASEQREILQRLRWDQTMNRLEPPHAKL